MSSVISHRVSNLAFIAFLRFTSDDKIAIFSMSNFFHLVILSEDADLCKQWEHDVIEVMELQVLMKPSTLMMQVM